MPSPGPFLRPLCTTAACCPLKKMCAARAHEMAAAARAAGCSLEAEIGHDAPERASGWRSRRAPYLYAAVDALRFAAESGCDALAVAIGTAHGVYAESAVDLEVSPASRACHRCPADGGSYFRTTSAPAAAGGISKINIFTHNNRVWCAPRTPDFTESVGRSRTDAHSPRPCAATMHHMRVFGATERRDRAVRECIRHSTPGPPRQKVRLASLDASPSLARSCGEHSPRHGACTIFPGRAGMARLRARRAGGCDHPRADASRPWTDDAGRDARKARGSARGEPSRPFLVWLDGRAEDEGLRRAPSPRSDFYEATGLARATAPPLGLVEMRSRRNEPDTLSARIQPPAGGLSPDLRADGAFRRSESLQTSTGWFDLHSDGLWHSGLAAAGASAQLLRTAE